jgi:hypothetical protein
MRIDSSGNVGIGTSSPSAKLNVLGATSYAGLTIQALLSDSTAPATGTGAVLAFEGKYDGTAYANYAAIGGLKENATSGNFAGYLGFYTRANGSLPAERMRIDSSGNVGVGTTSPGAKLSSNVSGAGSVTALNLTNDNTGLAAGTGPAINFGINSASLGAFGKLEVLNETATVGSNSYMAFSTRGGDVLAERMRINSSGNVGIGTSSPSNRLQIYQNTTFTVMAVENQTTNLQLQVNDGVATGAGVMLINGAYPLTFWTNSSERMRIDSSGNLLVGTTTSGGRLTVSQTSSGVFPIATIGSDRGINVQLTDTSGIAVYFTTSSGTVQAGQITVNTNTASYTSGSDYRLKNVTGALTGYKERLMSLQPKQGTWVSDNSEFRGFLAHEFANPYRASVVGEKDAVDADGKPVMQSMQASSSEVMADLVALVQEQQAIIESLKARLDAANL